MTSIVWFRRDLRLGDHRALAAAAAAGPVVPVFIRDDQVDSLGAAAKWRLGAGLERLAADLDARGSRLVLRSGPAVEVLEQLIDETGAQAVHWHRLYDPASIARDTAIKATLKSRGVAAESHAGHLLNEPWNIETGSGGFYKVYSPFWRKVRDNAPGDPVATPESIEAPGAWPDSEALDAWRLGRGMRRGLEIVAGHHAPGEAAARDRLSAFVEDRVDGYGDGRNAVAEDGTSRLSDYLAVGELSPRVAWHAARRRMAEGSKGAEGFLRQLVWRDFAYHLMYHSPHMLTDNWREGWDAFSWRTDPEHPDVVAWKQGRTGVDFVDAAMREMYVTGRMHNRTRMIAASYLTKHLMVHWKIGLDWFADCLTDWDPANNAMGWQWVAGCGPDAAPYFRVFNPDTQAEKFDPGGAYRRRWLAEGQASPPETALSFFDAAPRSWGLEPEAPRPKPIVSLAEGRERALAAYEAMKSAG